MASSSRRQPRISTVVTPSPVAGGQVSLQSKARVSLTRPTVTPDVAGDKTAMAKIVNDIAEAQSRATEAARSNPFNIVTIVKAQQLSHGVPVTLNHNLGNSWSYVKVVKAYAGSAIAAVTLVESTTAAPTGLTKANSCTFIPAIIQIVGLSVFPGSGTYDVEIA